VEEGGFKEEVSRRSTMVEGKLETYEGQSGGGEIRVENKGGRGGVFIFIISVRLMRGKIMIPNRN